MRKQLFHVFRNTPFGRETLIQSAYFCKVSKVSLSVYIPKLPQYLMYFDRGIVTVDLDRAFLRSPETARDHLNRILEPFGIPFSLFEPTSFTASALPEIPTRWKYMCCPRSISDLSTKVGLGYIGPRVRTIVRHSPFPVLITAPVYRPWKSIACFFGGSANSINTLLCSMRLSSRTGLPVQMITFGEGKSQEHYRKAMRADGRIDPAAVDALPWLFFEKGDIRENLFEVPHDALVVVGAYGHGLAKELFFGSKMELIQSVLPNQMLIVGPTYKAEEPGS
ncbi:MAG: universal stress protein [Acidobacteriota bacterium]